MRLDARSAAKLAFGLAFSLATTAACLVYLLWHDASDRSEVTPYLIAWMIAAAVAGTCLFAATRGPGRAAAVFLVVAVTTGALAIGLAATSSDTNVASGFLRISGGAGIIGFAAIAARFLEQPARVAWSRVRQRAPFPAAPRVRHSD
jgi:hypothetical protein